jgi:hypothetical protein
MFNRIGAEEQTFHKLRITPRPLEEQELTTNRIFGTEDPVVHKPQIRLQKTIQASLGKDPANEAKDKIYQRPVLERQEVKYEAGTPGVLSYQTGLPKELRSNLNFEDDKGPTFEDTQKKKQSTRKTNPNAIGRQSNIVFG